MEEKLIIFTHIPKTAGMTIWTIIKQNYGQCLYYDPRVNINKIAGKTSERKIIMGHLGFGFHQLLTQPYLYLTMLRHPIDRTISHYYYYQQSEMAINQYNPPLNWEEFCDRIANNLMTRFYAGVEFAYTKAYGSFVNLRLAKIQQDPKLQDYYNQSPTEMLSLAKQNLKEHFSFIGLVERFDETLLLLKQYLGWESIYYIPRNMGKKKPLTLNLSPETLSCIEKYNQLDIELYKYGAQLFATRIKQQDVAWFNQELKSFQSRNKRYGLLIKSPQVQAKLLEDLPPGL